MAGRAIEQRDMSIIEDVGRIIGSSSDPADSLREIVKLIAGRFGVDVCSIYIFDAAKNRLSLAATVGLSEDMVGKIYMSIDEGLTGLVGSEKDFPVVIKVFHGCTKGKRNCRKQHPCYH